MQTTFKQSNKNKISDSLYKTSINGLFFIPHKYFPDERGFYSELARTPEIDEQTGEVFTPKQFNQSRSNENVVRGIHAEGWNKLVSVTNGACFCALVDLRKNSPTYGAHETLVLGTTLDEYRGSIYISKGIGNSFCVIDGPADYVYAVDAIWSERNKSEDVSINLFDPDINILWPIPKDQMIFSQRDLDSVNLKDL